MIQAYYKKFKTTISIGIVFLFITVNPFITPMVFAQGGGCVVDLVFLLDTSGSMESEWENLCSTIGTVETDLTNAGYDVSVLKVAIERDPGDVWGSGADCADFIWDANSTPNGQNYGGSNTGHRAQEQWGAATEWYAEYYTWRDCATRVILPISDEGPWEGCGGNGAQGDACPGWPPDPNYNYTDWNITECALIRANANGVIVAPMLGEQDFCSPYTAGTMQYLADNTGGTFSNVSSPSDVSDFITTLVLDNCGMAITKEGPEEVCVDEEIDYTITVRNNFPETSTDVTITDTLPAGTTFISCSGGASCDGTTTPGVVTWDISTLAAGADAVLGLTISAPTPGTITNSVSITDYTNTCPGAVNDDSWDVIVDPLPACDIIDPPCDNLLETGNIASTTAGHNSYLWEITSGGTITAGQGTNQITFDAVQADPWLVTMNVTVVDQNGCTNTCTLACTVPVELASFTATATMTGVQLDWRTESEIENLGFVLERKSDGTGWTEIASYKSNDDLLGQGTVSFATDYTYTDQLVQAGVTYEYRLADVDYNGVVTYHSTRPVTVEQAPLAKVEEFTVMPAYPNPFNPSTTIRYGLDADSRVTINIYDISGNLISTLVNTEQSQGWHSVEWNGTNSHGDQVPAGMYLSRVSSGRNVKTNKLMLLK